MLSDTRAAHTSCATCRAYYDSNNLPEAKRTLLQAIHVAPMDHRLRFNLALVMQVRKFVQRAKVSQDTVC